MVSITIIIAVTFITLGFLYYAYAASKAKNEKEATKEAMSSIRDISIKAIESTSSAIAAHIDGNIVRDRLIEEQKKLNQEIIRQNEALQQDVEELQSLLSQGNDNDSSEDDDDEDDDGDKSSVAVKTRAQKTPYKKPPSTMALETKIDAVKNHMTELFEKKEISADTFHELYQLLD